MDIYKKLEELKIELPKPPAKGGVYTPAREFGDKFVYVSGCGPTIMGENKYTGKLGDTVTLEQGREAAKLCMLNVLSVVEAQIGDLNKIKRFIKNITFVSSANDFYFQPQVANGGSELLQSIFGDEIALAARSAVGVNVLPNDISVEIEMLLEIE